MVTRLQKLRGRALLLGIAIACISCSTETPPPELEDLQPAAPTTLKRLTLIEEPGPLGVGERVRLPELVTLDGMRVPASSQMAGRKALVIVMTSSGCPVSMSYGPRLAAIEAEYLRLDVGFVYVNCVAAETPEDMRQQVRENGFKGLYLPDRDHAVAAALGTGGARTTTEVFVLDPAFTLVYRGAVDDRFGVGATLDAPRRQFLRDALDATLAGERPRIGATWAPGCLLDAPTQLHAPARNLTYFGRISRILEASCVRCHRPTGPGPFSLASYQSIQGRASMIEAMLTDGLMPPSHGRDAGGAAPGGPWLNPPALSTDERDDLLAWLRSNRPVGTFEEAPVIQQRPQGWTIGTPEVLLTAGPMPLAAEGPMRHERFVVPTNVKDDRWISQVEFRPMKQELVHHAMVWILSPGSALPELDAAVPGAGGGPTGGTRGLELLGTYGPGQNVIQYGAGVARRLPAGSLLLVDLYARPVGKAMNTSLRIGLQFTKEQPALEVRSMIVQSPALRIRPGEPAARNETESRLEREVRVLAMTPYMRWRGKSLTLDATTPGGTGDKRKTTRLLDAPRYDPRWQIRYEYAEPLALPAGTVLKLRGVHDNSADNPNNQDPSRNVASGAGAGDEALLVALEILTPLLAPAAASDERPPVR